MLICLPLVCVCVCVSRVYVSYTYSCVPQCVCDLSLLAVSTVEASCLLHCVSVFSFLFISLTWSGSTRGARQLEKCGDLDGHISMGSRNMNLTRSHLMGLPEGFFLLLRAPPSPLLRLDLYPEWSGNLWLYKTHVRQSYYFVGQTPSVDTSSDLALKDTGQKLSWLTTRGL